MTGPHPTDRSLAALVDGRLVGDRASEVGAHVSQCSRCQLRIGASSAGVISFDQVEAAEPVAVAVLEESTAEPPVAGDVWRLAWDSISLLAVLWQVDLERVTVLPVVETADADDWSALLGGDLTSGLGELAVSVALETAVPWAVLDARVAQLADTEVLASLRMEYRTGASATTRRGDQVRSPLDDRLVGLEEVAEIINDMANATWAPVIANTEMVTFDYDLLVESGLPVNRALAISARGAAPTDAEADVIETATGVRPGIQPVHDALRRLIDQPRRKSAIRSRATANRRTEAAERLALARDAQPALAAARGTQGAAPDYDTILDGLLDA
jgi:hypothetical protein